MVDVVGALIRDERNRIFVQRRSPNRKLLPGTWDIVGGHVEPGESPTAALAREIEEETGWAMRRIETEFSDWEWDHDGVRRRERDYLVDVNGDLTRPRLEAGKHDAFAWVDQTDVELLMIGRVDGDRRLRDIVAKAARTRLTDRLRLEPIGPEHTHDFWSLHQDPKVGAWGGQWSIETTRAAVAQWAADWEQQGVHKWMAYHRSTGELIGCGGLSFRDLDGTKQLEVGWSLLSAHWGQGYATEIGRAGLRFAFDTLGAEEVVTFCEPANERSLAVMKRLGLRYDREFTYDGKTQVLYRTPPHPDE